jgi:hypothetical protein
MTVTPQKPMLTFVVGIAGHRTNKLSGDSALRAERQLGEVFAAMDAACAARLDHDSSRYAAGGYRIRLVSSFAEGADQLAIKVRPRHWEACAVLPFPRERYEQDFVERDSSGHILRDRRKEFRDLLGKDATVVELAESYDKPTEAYARAASFMLGQIDLLIAVWDGEKAAGKGGTAETVALALVAGIPVVWLSTMRDQPPRLLRDIREAALHSTEARAPTIADAVDQVFALGGMAAERLDVFLGEPWRPYCRWIAYDALRRFPLSWRWRWRIPARDLPEIKKEWEGITAQMPVKGGFRSRIEEILLPRFAAADMLASHFSHVYRSAFVLGYMCAAIAVAIALIGILPIGSETSGIGKAVRFKALLAAAELVPITAAIFIVGFGRSKHWHRRWLDYRALAESLRHLRFLAPIGACPRDPFQADGAERGLAWVRWYLHATIREIGCPNVVIDAEYQRALLGATDRLEVDAQISYHADNRDQLENLHHTLVKAGDTCFVAIGAILVVFLLAYLAALAVGAGPPAIARHRESLMIILHSAKPLMTYLAAFLPALGAAIAGIRFTGDFEGFADQSAQTADALANLKPGYARAMDEPDLAKTASILIETARVMTVDLGGWHSLYKRRDLTLPM